MNFDSLILLVLLIGIVVGVFMVLRQRRNRRNNPAAPVSDRNRRAMSDEALGGTVLLYGEHRVNSEIAGGVFDSTSRVRYLETDSWAHTHYTPDDVVYVLIPTDAGTLVAVRRVIEFGGTVNGVKEWALVRSRIEKAAAAAGVATSRGSRVMQRTAERMPNGAAIWRAAGDTDDLD